MQSSSRLLTAAFRGTSLERGRRYGEQFREHLKQSRILPFYLSYCEQFSPIQHPLMRTAIRWLHNRCASYLSPSLRELIQGFSSAAGLNQSEVARAVAMPDVLNGLFGIGERISALPIFGCTSIAAWGDYSQNGNFLYARNLDFPGNGVWDLFPLISRHKPEKGIPYVSIGTAGSIADAITCINEEGLTLSLHQHISTDTGLLSKARPILDLTLEVIQSARNIKEAEDICSRHKTFSGWSLVLTHWKERRAAVIQKTNGRTAVQKFEEGRMAWSNDFHDPEMRRTEINYPVWRESSRLRLMRAQEVLMENKGKMDASGMARLLNDHEDPERRVRRAFAQAISQPHTMTSVIFEPEKGIAWISEGNAPACEGPFRKFSLWEETGAGETLEGVQNSLNERQRRAYQAYLDSCAAWHQNRNSAQTHAKLQEAISLEPQDPVYRYLGGLFALKCGQTENALNHFECGSALNDIRHRQEAQKLWKARCLDILGRRDEALAAYSSLKGNPDNHRELKRAAKRGISSPYAASRAQSSMPDFYFGDAYVY